MSKTPFRRLALWTLASLAFVTLDYLRIEGVPQAAVRVVCALDPCGPLTGAMVENWARPPTPAEAERVEVLREACRRAQRSGGPVVPRSQSDEPDAEGARDQVGEGDQHRRGVE